MAHMTTPEWRYVPFAMQTEARGGRRRIQRGD